MEPLYSDNDLASMFEPERTRVGLAILVTEMRNRYEADRDALRARMQELEARHLTAEVADTIKRSLVSSESINDTYAWMKRVDAALKWLAALEVTT